MCCRVWFVFASNHLKNIVGCTPELEIRIVGFTLMKSCTCLFPTDAGGRFSMAKPSPKAFLGRDEMTTETSKNVKMDNLKSFFN